MVQKTQIYQVTIKGLSPLMHNRYPLEDAGKPKTKSKGKLFNAKEAAEKCLYKTPDGIIYQPADHIEGALIEVGSTIVKTGRKTFKDDMKTNIQVNPQEIPFPNGKDYTVDVRTGVIPATGGRVPIGRPRWDNWQFTFTITVFNPDELAPETLKTLLETAGKAKGIGTYRPKFGRFQVTEFEAKKTLTLFAIKKSSAV